MKLCHFEWTTEWEKMTKIGKCLILGGQSEIAQGLEPFLKKDGWQIEGWSRGQPIPMLKEWDLSIISIGKVGPVGLWSSLTNDAFEECIYSNLILPFKLLKAIWPWRRENASVCFMAGSNPNKPMSGYSPYNASKMGLLKLCEQLDFESPEGKFFALAPGYVNTKIHKPTLERGWKNERIEKGGSTPISKIYEALNWCLAQPKEIVGGRNICVSDHPSTELQERLESDPSLFKLRRYEGR